MTKRGEAVILVAICLLWALLAAEAYYDRQLFRSIVFDDNSNDDAIYMNANKLKKLAHMEQQQLLKRSGFDYEEHYAIANDGYITLLLRIVNPLVKRFDLRGPPVMLYHGFLQDQAAYLAASSIQHHPEPWPRSPSDGPMSSSNRSLGFMLANNGFDVWLVGTRGSNRHNQGHTEQVNYARNHPFEPTAENYELIETNKRAYWSYSLDDIIESELGEQMDTVLRVAGARELVLFAFSLSATTSMAFLGANRDYAQKVRVYFQMAPPIGADHFTLADKILVEKLCPILPSSGLGLPLLRKALLSLSKYSTIRYSLIRKLLTTFYGPSQKYQTNLERNYLAHILLPAAFKAFQHNCQMSLGKQLAKFDYGPEENTARYNQPAPPAYNISHIAVQNWVLISGSYDGLADATTVQRLAETSHAQRPIERLICPAFNHLDFQGGLQNDKYVNLPVLDTLNRLLQEPAQSEMVDFE